MGDTERQECERKGCTKTFTPGREWGKWCSASCGNKVRSKKRTERNRKALKFYELHHNKELRRRTANLLDYFPIVV